MRRGGARASPLFLGPRQFCSQRFSGRIFSAARAAKARACCFAAARRIDARCARDAQDVIDVAWQKGPAPTRDRSRAATRNEPQSHEPPRWFRDRCNYKLPRGRVSLTRNDSPQTIAPAPPRVACAGACNMVEPRHHHSARTVPQHPARAFNARRCACARIYKFENRRRNRGHPNVVRGGYYGCEEENHCEACGEEGESQEGRRQEEVTFFSLVIPERRRGSRLGGVSIFRRPHPHVADESCGRRRRLRHLEHGVASGFAADILNAHPDQSDKFARHSGAILPT